jgi:DNA-binding response OmpR family regulator
MARVLIVEDEYLTANAMAAELEAVGHEAVVVADGRQALDWLAGNVPDLIVTDYMMPRLDGAALIRAVRADPRLAAVPVVMATSASTENIRPKGLEVQALLAKPVGRATLLATVRKLLRA